MRSDAIVFAVVLLTGFAAVCATRTDAQEKGLPEGPSWGGGRFQPRGANVLFATGDGCALCHSASPRAAALLTATGDDVSPYGLWQGTLMANAFRDPYWRAQVSYETSAAPERAAMTEALCLRCHGPMAHHTARIAGTPSPRLADAEKDPLAQDGVSCTVCHQARPEVLGTPEGFDGRLDIRAGRAIFGPFPDPITGPMQAHAAFTPTEGAHVRDAALCGACHTLTTKPAPDHPGFVEQAPFLEWRNSVYAAEGAEARTCQECHMPAVGTMRIARNPAGLDFNMASRDGVRGHAFVGGNAVMLGLLRAHREELGVTAEDRALERMEDASRRLLREETARLTIGAVTRRSGRLSFDVHVENLTGHKLPTGYPSRRVWLRLQVRDGRTIAFAVGDPESDGRIRGVRDERRIPHTNLVRNDTDVVVYEAVPLDGEGAPTTRLVTMSMLGKDTRLLPKGWAPDGPHAAATAPVGVGDDKDFRPGEDTVHVDIALPRGAGDDLLVVAWLLYQPIPPAWVAPLRTVDTAEARRFVKMYDDAKPAPETLAVTTRREKE